MSAVPNAFEFLAKVGRFPWATDDPPAWEYRGWLLLYVIEAHRVRPEIPDRWGYYLRLLEGGRLTDEPIPGMLFGSGCHADVRRSIESALRVIEQGASWHAWGDLVAWLAYALAVPGVEPPGLDRKVQEVLYRDISWDPMVLHAGDHLGSFLADITGKGWNPNAFYPTPFNVVRMIVACLMGSDDEDQRVLTVHDPCVGTGRFLLEASNRSLRLSGQDIDPGVLRICLINGALYAPWLTFSPPGHLFPADPSPVTPPVPAVVAPTMNINRRGQGLLFGT